MNPLLFLLLTNTTGLSLPQGMSFLCSGVALGTA